MPEHEFAPRRQARADELAQQIDKIFRRLRLAVVYGGNKSVRGAVIEETHNQRSWKSYEVVAGDIAAAMKRLGCRHVRLIPDDMRLGEELRAEQSHLAWLNSAGVQGQCSVSHAPAMLELFGIPYIGHDPMTAAMLDNKHVFKRQLRAAGLPTADFYVWQPGSGPFDPVRDASFQRQFGAYPGPYIVKPVSGRASLHVTYVPDRSGLAATIAEVYEITRNHVLVEKYIDGREFCIGVSGPVISLGGRIQRLATPFVFSALERNLAPDEKIFTSMDVKPITGERARVLDPVRDAATLTKLEKLARDVFTELGIETLIRLDIRADSGGNLFVLEANPKPDLKAPDEKSTSLLCIGLPQIGMTYDDLILSVFADRMDALLSERRGKADRLLRLL